MVAIFVSLEVGWLPLAAVLRALIASAGPADAVKLIEDAPGEARPSDSSGD